MKNIIVPIDFSRDAMNALDHAINLANKFQADLRVIHIRKEKDYDQPFIIKGKDNVYGKTVQEFCKTIIANKQDKYKVPRGKFDFVIKHGKIYLNIIEQAKKDKSDLIMMGTHGVSGFEEFWLGSNAYRVVSKAPCPVLTVRHGFNKKGIKKIILPIDAHRETRQKVPVIIHMAKTLGAEVHVVDVRSTDRADIKKRLKKYGDQAYDLLRQQGITTIRTSKKGGNVANATIAYAVHADADLIAIVSNQRGTPLNMHLSTTAQQMVNHSPIPILSIHPTF